MKHCYRSLWLIVGGLLITLGCNSFTSLLATATPLPTNTPIPTATPVPPTATPAPTEPAYVPTFERKDCSFDTPVGAKVKCGFVTVPEDRDGDLTDMINLAVAVYLSPQSDPDSAPVIFLEGGPGASAVENISRNYYQNMISPLLEKHDVILFDARGVGLSTPSLDCLKIKLLYVQLLGQEVSAADREQQYEAAFRQCHDRLKEDGVEVKAYTSVANAADVKDIVSALGYERVNLYAVSYGTRVAQIVMRDFPELVNAAVLDSPVPLTAKIYNDTAARSEQALETLFTGCAADPNCNAAYPDLETEYNDLVAKFHEQPVEVTIPASSFSQAYTDTLTDLDIASDMIWGMGSPYILTSLPKAIRDTAAGDYGFLGYAENLPLYSYQDISLGAMLSSECTDQVYATTPEQLAADLASHPDTETLGLSFAFGSAKSLFSICKTWGAAPYDERERQPVTGDIPTLILSGEYDPITPPDYGQQIAESLSQSVVYTLPGESHAPSLGPRFDCPMTLVSNFLSNSKAVPDGSCVAKMDEPQFFVPFTSEAELEFVPYQSDENYLTGVMPKGWTDIDYGFFSRSGYVTDPTQIGLQSDPTKTADWALWLEDNFGGLGLDGKAVLVGQYKANGQTWKLYTATFQGNPVDLAYTEVNGRTFLVAMMSTTDEHDALYDALFLHSIDRVVPNM